MGSRVGSIALSQKGNHGRLRYALGAKGSIRLSSMIYGLKRAVISIKTRRKHWGNCELEGDIYEHGFCRRVADPCNPSTPLHGSNSQRDLFPFGYVSRFGL